MDKFFYFLLPAQFEQVQSPGNIGFIKCPWVLYACPNTRTRSQVDDCFDPSNRYSEVQAILPFDDEWFRANLGLTFQEEENPLALEIEENEVQGIIVLEFSGRLVLGQESMDFRGKIKEVLEKSDWIKQKWGWDTRIVLDLGKLGFVDSAGLGALIAARTSAVSRGAGIKLANLTKKLRDALTITKLVTVFDVYDSVEAAVNSFPAVEPAKQAPPAQA